MSSCFGPPLRFATPVTALPSSLNEAFVAMSHSSIPTLKPLQRAFVQCIPSPCSQRSSSPIYCWKHGGGTGSFKKLTKCLLFVLPVQAALLHPAPRTYCCRDKCEIEQLMKFFPGQMLLDPLLQESTGEFRIRFNLICGHPGSVDSLFFMVQFSRSGGLGLVCSRPSSNIAASLWTCCVALSPNDTEASGVRQLGLRKLSSASRACVCLVLAGFVAQTWMRSFPRFENFFRSRIVNADVVAAAMAHCS